MKLERDNGYGHAKPALWPWLAVTALASAALQVTQFADRPPQIENWQLWARYTARLSFFLFLASYIAAPAYELSQNRATTWLRKNRRNAGISFGLAHTIHLLALVSFQIISDTAPDMATVIVGGGAYLAMFAMLATSNDAAIRRLGQQNWRRLHKFGAHYLAFVFLFIYTASLLEAHSKPFYLIALIWAAIIVRIYVAFNGRQTPEGRKSKGEPTT